MRALIASLLLAISMAICMPAQSFAADGHKMIDIDLPDGYKIEKKTDISAALLSRLFGPTWHEIVGNVSTESDVGRAASEASGNKGGLGIYDGLIISILGVLNLAAMAYVAVAIIYMWGIFAVTTAHEGNKLGGSLYNSLWVPVRHACSFSLTVPILNGLSLMQVAIMACVALSINFANKVWDASGAYIVEHAHVGIIDSSAPMIETEAYAIIPVMFADAAIGLIEMSADNLPNTSAINTKSDETYVDVSPTFPLSPAVSDVKASPNQLLGYVRYNHRSGTAMLAMVPPKGMKAEWFGAINFDYPKMDCKESNGNWKCSQPTGENAAAYNLKKQLADVRINNTKKLWQDMGYYAYQYLRSYSSGGGTTCVFPQGSGSAAHCDAKIDEKTLNNEVIGIVHNYMVAMTQDSRAIVNSLINSETDAKIKQAIGKAIDSNGGQSKFGWVSAGLFTFSLASLQQKIDEQVMTRISATYPKSASGLQTDERSMYNPFNGRWLGVKGDNRTYTGAQKTAIDGLDEYIASVLLGNERYAAAALAQNSDNDPFFSTLSEWLIAQFVGEGTVKNGSNLRSTGILATVLNEFGVYDPMIVMSAFGHKLLGLLNWGTAAVAGGLSAIGLSFAISALGLLLMAGFFFAYIVPITPVIFWLKALLSWLYLVVESMVAAPFWCCSHALPEGAGFAGQHAKRGYLMLLDIVIRPTLLVIGAVFAVAIIQACGWMFNVLFNSWFANITGTFIEIGVIADISFTIVVMSTMYYISYTVFTKGVNYLPEKVVQWCGGMAGGMKDEEHGTQAIIAAGGMAMYARSIGGELGQAAGGAMRAAGKLGLGAAGKAAGAMNRAAAARRGSEVGNAAPALGS